MTAEFSQLQFEKTIATPPARVFTALTSSAERMAWGTPDADSVLQIENQPTPAPGVREIAKIGPKENPYVDVATDWVIMDAPHRLLYAETLSAEGEDMVTSLATFELSEADAGTALKVTVQLVNFGDDEMGQEVEQGWTHAMEALVQHCDAILA